MRKFTLRLVFAILVVISCVIAFAKPEPMFSPYAYERFCRNSKNDIISVVIKKAPHLDFSSPEQVMKVKSYFPSNALPECPYGGAYILGGDDESVRCVLDGTNFNEAVVNHYDIPHESHKEELKWFRNKLLGAIILTLLAGIPLIRQEKLNKNKPASP